MITEIRLDTQAQDGTLIPSKITTIPTDDFTFPRDVIAVARQQAGDGTAASPSLTFSSDLTTGIFRQAAGAVSLAASGAEYLRITPTYSQAFNAIRAKNGGSASAPDIVVGNTTTGIFNPSGSTEMHFTVGSSDRLNHNGVQWESFSPFRFEIGSAGVPGLSWHNDPTTGIFSAGSGTWAVSTSGTERFRIDTGDVTSQLPIIITPTTNQLILGTTNTTTINSTAPSASRIYSIPDAGTNSSFILADGNQFLNGTETFTSNVYVAQQAPVSNANVFITSRVGVSSPAQGGNLTLSAGDYPGSAGTSSSTGGSLTLTSGGASNGGPSITQGGSVTLTSGGALVNVGGANGEAHGGSITLTTGSVSQTFGSGLSNKTRGGSITLTSGSCVTSNDDLGGNITLTSFTPANGGSIVLTGTGANGSPGSPAKGNIFANYISVSDGTAGSPSHTFTSDTTMGMYKVSSNLFFSTGGTTQLGIVNAGQLQGRDGSAGAPTYSFFNDNSSGWYRIGSGDFGFSVSGTKQLEVTSSGLTLTMPLAVSSGGTGLASLTAHAVLLGEGSSNVAFASPGTTAYPLVSNGATSDPSFQQLSLTAGVVGTLPIGNGGTNSNAALTGSFLIVSNGTSIIQANGSDFSMNSGKITNVKDPTLAQDAATKNYVDMSVNGLTWKFPVAAATTTVLPFSPAYSNGSSGVGATLTATAFGALVIDGYTVNLNDRVLVKNQASGFQDGIYTLTTVGTGSVDYVLTRAVDSNTPSELESGTAVFATSGTVNADTGFIQTTTGTVVIGTTNLVYITFTSVVTSYSAGTGLDLTGTTFSISVDNSLNANAGGSVPSLTVKEDPAGAISTGGSGIKVNIDNSSIGITGNNIYVKPAGITYAMTNIVTRETPSGTVDGTNTMFTLAFTPASGSEQIYQNGVLQDYGATADYTLSGATITFVIAPKAGSTVRAIYWKA